MRDRPLGAYDEIAKDGRCRKAARQFRRGVVSRIEFYRAAGS